MVQQIKDDCKLLIESFIFVSKYEKKYFIRMLNIQTAYFIFYMKIF